MIYFPQKIYGGRKENWTTNRLGWQQRPARSPATRQLAPSAWAQWFGGSSTHSAKKPQHWKTQTRFLYFPSPSVNIAQCTKWRECKWFIFRWLGWRNSWEMCSASRQGKKSPKTVMQRLCSIFKPLIQSICDIWTPPNSVYVSKHTHSHILLAGKKSWVLAAVVV